MGDNSGEDYAKQQLKQQEARERDIRRGTQQVNNTFDSTYNKGYYDNHKQQYMDMAEPDLQRQASKKHSSMLFNMARQGLAGGNRTSNSADRNFAELDAAKGRQLIAMERNADNVVNQRRNAVEQARANVLGQLNISGDADAALQAANNQTDMAAAAPHYQAAGDLFVGAGQGLIGYNDLYNLRDRGNADADYAAIAANK